MEPKLILCVRSANFDNHSALGIGQQRGEIRNEEPRLINRGLVVQLADGLIIGFTALP
jgi:hypothetical protein